MAVTKAYRAWVADIADEPAFLSAMQECATDFPPTAGVVQIAMILRDTLFEKISYTDWTEPMRPKVQGPLNLHLPATVVVKVAVDLGIMRD